MDKQQTDVSLGPDRPQDVTNCALRTLGRLQTGSQLTFGAWDLRRPPSDDANSCQPGPRPRVAVRALLCSHLFTCP